MTCRPMQALLAAFQRFTTSQNAVERGWGYVARQRHTNTMTSVGLLGLAMGHGASPEIIRFNPKDPKDLIVKPALEDPKIQSGLQALARNIGEPQLRKEHQLPACRIFISSGRSNGSPCSTT